jgi:hypothetical protein
MYTADGDMARCEYEEMAPEHAKSRHDDSEATYGMLSDAPDADSCSCPTGIVNEHELGSGMRSTCFELEISWSTRRRMRLPMNFLFRMKCVSTCGS